MTEKIKKASRITSEAIEDTSIVIALVSMVASGCLAAVHPLTKSGVGSLPIWQIVAAIQFVLILGFVFKLVHKRNG